MPAHALPDILAGKKTTKYSGEVYLNGHQRDHLYPRVTSYVPQADVMFPHTLVHEAVSFTAKLSRPMAKAAASNRQARKEFEGIIHEHLSQLGLGEVASTKVGSEDVRGISGGQRRRVTLCKGIISGAYVLFCDEPTSGLSSTDAEVAVKLMKVMTKKLGLSIFVVIHQPKTEVAALFDHLVLLTSEPGRMVYNGPMADAMAHYAKLGFPVPDGANPADYFLDLVSPSFKGQQIEALVNYYDAHCAAGVKAQVNSAIAAPGKSAYQILKERSDNIEARLGPLTMPSNSVYAAPFAMQLRAVFGRQFTLLMRDRKSLRTDFLTAIVKAVIVGIGFFDTGSNTKLQQMPFLFMCIQMSVLSGMQSMPALIAERQIMKFECSDRLYREWAFLISTFILDNIVSQLANLVFLVLVFAFSRIPYSSFPSFWLWQLLVVLVTDSMFSAIAAVAKTGAQAQKIAIPPLIFILLFNGFFITLSGVQEWMVWAIYISPMFWGLQEMVSALYQDFTPKGSPDYPRSGQFVIDQCMRHVCALFHARANIVVRVFNRLTPANVLCVFRAWSQMAFKRT